VISQGGHICVTPGVIKCFGDGEGFLRGEGFLGLALSFHGFGLNGMEYSV